MFIESVVECEALVINIFGDPIYFHFGLDNFDLWVCT